MAISVFFFRIHLGNPGVLNFSSYFRVIEKKNTGKVRRFPSSCFRNSGKSKGSISAEIRDRSQKAKIGRESEVFFNYLKNDKAENRSLLDFALLLNPIA